jgi:hypothetical protein
MAEGAKGAGAGTKAQAKSITKQPRRSVVSKPRRIREREVRGLDGFELCEDASHFVVAASERAQKQKFVVGFWEDHPFTATRRDQ